LEWYKRHPNVELVAVSDIIKERAKRMGELYHIKSYTDTEEMLEEEKPDITSIVTPQYNHCELTLAAVKAGVKGILCEKPMATSLEECDKMIKATEKKGVKLEIGHMKRFNLGLQKVKEILDSGKIGKAHHIWAHQSISFSDSALKERKNQWRNVLNLTGGGVLPETIHYLDIFRWMLGDVTRVYGEINRLFPELGLALDDHAVVLVRFRNGAIGTLTASAAGLGFLKGQWERGGIYGTNGGILFTMPDWLDYTVPEVSMLDRRTGLWTNHQLALYRDEFDGTDFTHHHYYRQTDYFVKCVQKDIQPIPSGKDGRAALEMIFGAYQSWYSGKSIQLPLKKTPPLKKIFAKFKQVYR
jgi:predicted dehydrogenase